MNDLTFRYITRKSALMSTGPSATASPEAGETGTSLARSDARWACIVTLLAEVVRVECYAGSRGEETPRRVLLGGRWEELNVLGRWVSEDAETGTRRRYFRVATEPG